VAALEVPFHPSQIEWRVMNTTKGKQPARGQMVPYAMGTEYHVGMSRIRPQCLDADCSERSARSDVLLREEPDEEEDDEEDEGNVTDDEGDDDERG
jgi:hypothetical protein